MTAQTFAETLDAIIDQRSLLKHPFYQAWTAGTLPLEALREYAKQYFHFEAAFPTFLSAVHARMEPGAARQAVLQNLWDAEHGERNHLALWLQFCESLGLAAAATTAEARLGIEEAARTAADRLWRFLDGAYEGAHCA
jgi:pyrroloquinoline-quinone synthase